MSPKRKARPKPSQVAAPPPAERRGPLRQRSSPEAVVERRRQALRDHLRAAEMTVTELAAIAGLGTPNSLFNFLNSHSKGLSQKTLEALVGVLPGATIASLMGLEPPDDVTPPQRLLQVRSVAAAGLLQGSFDLPAAQHRQIALPIETAMQVNGVFGVEVRDPGAEKIFPAGTVLVSMPLASWEGELASGKRVILQRVIGPKVEVTVRELELQANEAWLWLRSTHPEYQAPVSMPYAPGRPVRPWRIGDDRLSIAAVVVAAYMPQG